MKPKRNLTAILILVLITAHFATCPAHAAEKLTGKLTGKLEMLKGVRVLTLTGTPRENGYTQGNLLAKEVMALADDVGGMLQRFTGNANYDAVAAVAKVLIATNDRERAEAEGMIEGIRAKLGDEGLQSKVLGRAITADDILVVNALPDLRGLGCSSFAAWGDRTRDGELLVGRNLDYFGREAFSAAHVLVVRKSPDPKRKSCVALSFVGLIGVNTAINEDGILQATHDSGGMLGMPRPPLRLRTHIARDLVELISPKGNVAENAANFCREHRTAFATNFLIVGPKAPAGVLEYDQNLRKDRGVSLRLPAEGQDWIVTTNHFRIRREPTDCRRYAALAERLQAGPKLASLDDAWKLITRASVDGTLHTLVYRPKSRTMLLSFSTPDAPAHKVVPVQFTLDQLLDNTE